MTLVFAVFRMETCEMLHPGTERRFRTFEFAFVVTEWQVESAFFLQFCSEHIQPL